MATFNSKEIVEQSVSPEHKHHPQLVALLREEVQRLMDDLTQQHGDNAASVVRTAIGSLSLPKKTLDPEFAAAEIREMYGNAAVLGRIVKSPSSYLKPGHDALDTVDQIISVNLRIKPGTPLKEYENTRKKKSELMKNLHTQLSEQDLRAAMVHPDLYDACPDLMQQIVRAERPSLEEMARAPHEIDARHQAHVAKLAALVGQLPTNVQVELLKMQRLREIKQYPVLVGQLRNALMKTLQYPLHRPEKPRPSQP